MRILLSLLLLHQSLAFEYDDHAIIYIYKDKPLESMTAFAETATFPVYMIKGPHKRFPSNQSSIYVSIRNITIPFLIEPRNFNTMHVLIPNVYKHVPNPTGGLINGNRTIDKNILEICIHLPSIACKSTNDVDTLSYNGSIWDGQHLDIWLRRTLVNMTLINIYENFTIFNRALKLYKEHFFIYSDDDMEAFRPLANELQDYIAFTIYEHPEKFRTLYSEPEMTGMYIHFPDVNHTYRKNLSPDTVRTFITTCTETI